MCQAERSVIVWIPQNQYGKGRRCCVKSWYACSLSLINVEVPSEPLVEKKPLEVPDLVKFIFTRA